MLIWILPVFPSVSLDVLIYYRVQGVLQIMTRHLTLLLLMRLCFLMSEAREDILLMRLMEAQSTAYMLCFCA